MSISTFGRGALLSGGVFLWCSGAWAQVLPSDLEARTFTDHWSEAGTSGNFALPYRIFKPTGFDTGTTGSLPLVIYLHGAGERGTDNLSQLSNWSQPMGFVQSAIQNDHPSFFVAPQQPLFLDPSDPRYNAGGEYWVNNFISDPDQYSLASVPPSRSLSSVFDLVDNLRTEFPTIDPNRVYITGWSSGGDATWYAMLTRPDLFAAGVPLAGLGDPSATAGSEIINRGIWGWHGIDDSTVPYTSTQKMVDSLVAAGGTVGNTSTDKLRENLMAGENHFSILEKAYGSGPSDPNLSTNPLYSWLFSQSLEPAAVLPEPGTLVLALLGLTVGFLRRR